MYICINNNHYHRCASRPTNSILAVFNSVDLKINPFIKFILINTERLNTHCTNKGIFLSVSYLKRWTFLMLEASNDTSSRVSVFSLSFGLFRWIWVFINSALCDLDLFAVPVMFPHMWEMDCTVQNFESFLLLERFCANYNVCNSLVFTSTIVRICS